MEFEMDVADEYERFVAKLGKWEEEALAAVQSNGFWCTLVIAHISRNPLRHFENYLKASGARPSKIPMLVSGKAISFLTEWEKLLGDQARQTVWSVLWIYAAADGLEV